MKKAIAKSTFAVVAVVVSSLGAWKAYEAYEYNDKSILTENIEALTQDGGDNGGGNYKRPCNVDLKKGGGVWRCGNPCVYESRKIRRNSLEQNQSYCYFYAK